MSITFDPAWSSGEISITSGSFEGILRGTDDYTTALAEAVSQIPGTFYNGVNTLYLVSIDEMKRISEECWRIPYRYGSAQQAQQQNQEFATESSFARSFDIGGGTVKITHSKETVASYVPAGETAVNFKQGINVTDTGVEGCDIYAGPSTFTETRNFASSDYDSLASTCDSLKNCVNSATFLGKPAGSVLYIGASLSVKGSAEFGEVANKFLYSRNLTGITVGDITGITKRGHDYLWIRSKETVDAGAKRVKLIPTQVNVERLYDYVDLNNIPNINSY